jgi:hypothetical protein
MRTSPRMLSALLLAAALAPAAGHGAAPPPPLLSSVPVEKGAVVKVDLSRLPSRVEVRGVASCVGSRMTATGDWEPVHCQRPFTFEAPLLGNPIVMVFQPKGGGRPIRLEYPLERDPRPRTFAVPSAGTVSTPPPPAKGAGSPPPVPADQVAKVRAAATASCGECGGASNFGLKDFKLDETPPSALDVLITIQPPP